MSEMLTLPRTLESPSAADVALRAGSFAWPVGPILVATDGGPSTENVLRAAALLAAAWTASVEVLLVTGREESHAGGVALGFEPLPDELDPDLAWRRETVEATAERELRDGSWHLELRRGVPARAIAREAAQRGASLIVLGRGQHSLLGTVFGGDVVLRTLQRATCPVLVVGEHWSALPARAVVGVDFSVASVWAAEVATRFVRPGGLLDVVHVAPKRVAVEPWSVWERQYATWAHDRLDRVSTLLARQVRSSSRASLQNGEVAASLLQRARAPEVGLLVVGASGTGRLERLVVGNVATAVVRATEGNVLAVAAPPIGEADRIAEALGFAVEHRRRDEWASALDAFSKRNAGRQAWLDTIDPERDGFAQECGFAFRGAVYDAADDRIFVILGSSDGSTSHLTRSVERARSLAIHMGKDGREQCLTILHGEGLTELRLGDRLG
jgi:nucleotide-binding universal stress UspA family protein